MLAQQALKHFFAIGAAGAQAFQILLAAQALTYRDKLHLGRHDATARVVHLRYVGATLGAAWRALQIKTHRGQFRVGQAFLTVFAAWACQHDGIATLFDPCAAQGVQSATNIDIRIRGGFFSPLNIVGVSSCSISRNGTRISAREPV